jgi:tRNA(adenine34) deaminase
VTPAENNLDAQWMQAALAQAQAAGAAGEVPVGAVVLCSGQLIAAGRNAPIDQLDPSAHAEMVALRAAAVALGNYRLDDCELFVTLEPCAMCAGAMLHARLKRVVFGAFDPKTGAAGSVVNLFANPQLNHQTAVVGGVLASESSAVLQDFFRQQRQQRALVASPIREDALRTRPGRFDGVRPMPGQTNFVSDLPTLEGLRLHYAEAGPSDASSVSVCLHGPDSWSQIWCEFMHERADLGELVLAIDLIGFGKSDKLKRASAYSSAWHLQVLVELLARLNLSRVVLLEPAGDTLPGNTGNETLGQALLSLLPARVLRRESVSVVPLNASDASAPYPDQGHRAALRALKAKDQP